MTRSRRLGEWLRRQREERLWSRNEMAHRLIEAAENRGDTTMPRVDDVAHNVYRWERGVVSPSERYRLFYCEAFGIPPDRFGSFSEASPQGRADAGMVVITITLKDPAAKVIAVALTRTG